MTRRHAESNGTAGPSIQLRLPIPLHQCLHNQTHAPHHLDGSSRPETPYGFTPKRSIKEFLMQKMSPILQAKREKNTRKNIKRQYGESLTSDENIQRMLEEEEEKKKKE
ncbi:hypothetical protein PoB_004599700 [Plakobranchus ocellatus]|uniref:Uncharacterized protein n=1 Tax=Plakobranchus ocellatus TaxID=259542 RepID=A0AAV4BJI4_9GAST|nr:hypothetical protein PoB_004599700 [Plakobranchus ocellatus]